MDGEAAKCYFNNGRAVVTRYGKEIEGLEGHPPHHRACDVLKEVDEAVGGHESVLEFEGHETCDWGYGFREMERGLEKRFEMMMN